MDYVLSVLVTPKTAANLVLSNEIDVNCLCGKQDSKIILDAIAEMEVRDILKVIDFSATRDRIDVTNIPQFGNKKCLMKVPSILSQKSSCGINYAQLGFGLKQDPDASTDANTKFGENHGKAASILGIAKVENGRFFSTPLGEGFSNIVEEQSKEHILTYLYFRIPIVQIILKEAKDKTVNGYEFMSGITATTKERRGQCLRAIFRQMLLLDDSELNGRIRNIIWEIGEQKDEEV